MGGLGSGHEHSDAVQIIAFVVSLFLPGGVLALLVGAWLEQAKRKLRQPPATQSAATAAPLPTFKRPARKAA